MRTCGRSRYGARVRAQRNTWRSKLIAAFYTAGVVFGAAGCAAFSLLTPAFDTTLTGTAVTLAMPKVDGERPMLTVDVSVGGSVPTPLLVDTGSPGLRIFASKVGQTDVTRSQTPVDVTFADGTRFIGVEASAPVSFGGLSTKGAIKVQLITAVGCADGKPSCAGAIGIDKFAAEQPFAGLLGIGLQANAIYSPISQLESGSPSAISISADPAAGSGVLTFNQLPAAPMATFDMPAWTQPRQPNGYPAWASNQARACWAYGGQPTRCVPTAFDTGSPTLFTDSSVPGAPAVTGQVPRGTSIALSASAGGPTIWSVRSGSTPGRSTVAVESLDGGNNVNSGLSIFRSNAVTFDLQNGKVLIGPPK